MKHVALLFVFLILLASLTATTALAAEKPNILFIMTDQQRGDCVGCYGDVPVITPNIDRIAERGVRFRRAYTATPSCTPARTGLLTGWRPWRHGMLGYSRVPEYYPNELPKMVRESGYYTLGIGKMHWFPQRTLHGFHKTILDESGRSETKGFINDHRRWVKKVAPDIDPDITGLSFNDYRAKTYQLPEKLHPTAWTGQTAVDFLEQYDQSEPWFLKVSFARPHSPYDPPKRFVDMYDGVTIPPARKAEWSKKYATHRGGQNAYNGDFGPEQVEKSRRHYYANITFIDEQVGRILEVLKKRGWNENTLIIFTADHGDMMGDHNHWRKTYAYEGSARIPMIVAWPKDRAAKLARGSESDRLVELRDILPTLLDAAGTFGDYDPSRFDGRSILELVRGDDSKWRTVLDLEHSRCYWPENQWNALTDARYKYIYFSYDGTEQLFDLQEDPDETVNLAADETDNRADNRANAELLAKWRARMVEHLKERGPEWVKDGKLQTHKNHLHGKNFPGFKGRKR